MTRFGIVRAALTRPVVFGRAVAAVVVCVGVASLIRALLGSAADTVPFVTFFPAIVICTLLAGWQAGVASIFASMAVVHYLFLKVPLRPSHDPQSFAMMALFLLSCVLLVAVAQTLRTTFCQLNVLTERSKLLNRELVHRSRNLLTVVNALASATFESDRDQFPSVFAKRIGAMASGLDALTIDTSGACELRSAIENAVRPFQNKGRIAIVGESCSVPGDVAIPLALAIHELCTNAVKYGSLSVPGGSVEITLAVPSPGDGAVVKWEEVDGPHVTLPTREGLGTALLHNALLGPAEVEFANKGLRCTLSLRMI